MSVTKIGRYEVTGELGKGAMGLVYKAVDPMIGRTVALKTMRLDVHGLETDEMLRRFKNEARLAGVLNHPNIVTIYDAGEQDGMFYIAMEFVEGISLHSVLQKRKTLPPEEMLDVVRQICAGLDHAHKHGVIHRDIKPANVMIETDGTVKIMDFGIAKSGGGLTSTGQVLGTPNYMSPEQIKGHPLDGRCDLFSLGVILYEMVTGNKPFGSDNVTTIIYKIINDTPVPPRDLNAAVHPRLNDLVVKSLAKNPAQRFQSGAEIVKAFEGFQHGEPSSETTQQIPTTVAVSAGGSPAGVNLPGATVAGAAATATAPTAATQFEPQPSVRTADRSAAPSGGHIKLIVAVLVISVLVLLGAAYKLHRPTPAAEPAVTQDAIPPVETSTAPTPSAPASATAAPPEANPGTDSAATTTTEKPAAKPAKKKSETSPAAPPASTPAGIGKLQLSSIPDGAVVKIDGKAAAGPTPLSASDLASGPHTIEFSKAGYGTESRVIEVVAGKTSFVSVKLNTVPGTVAVQSQPEGAAIWVDGKNSGKVTPAQLTVTSGAHQLVLKKEGFDDLTLAAPASTQPQTLSATLTVTPPAPATEGKKSGNPFGKLKKIFGGNSDEIALPLKSSPSGATITVNGTEMPVKTPTSLKLPPAKYDITLSLDGYKPVTRTITLEKGASMEVNETLTRK